MAFNAKLKAEGSPSDKLLYNGKEDTTTKEEKRSEVLKSTLKYKDGELSSNKPDNSSSARVSPMSRKAPCPNIIQPLPPLTIFEQSINRPKSDSMDIDGSRDTSLDTNEKQQLIDVDLRMRDRPRLLGGYSGYNTISNASRIRDEQVFFDLCFVID